MFEYFRRVSLCAVILLTIIIFKNNFHSPYQHFSMQADSFISGRLDIPEPSHDFVLKDGKYFWPQGPFPSIVLVPFQFMFGNNFNQSTMQIFLIILIATLTFKLAQSKGFNNENSFYLTTAFMIGTPLVGLIVDPRSWFFAQIVTTALLMALIYLFMKYPKPLIMGLVSGLIIACRPTAALFLFAILYYLYKYPVGNKLKNLSLFLLPILAITLILGWFNYTRFGNAFDNGYGTNEVGGAIGPLREHGIFSISHIPSNVYYYFFKSIDPITNGSPNLVFPYYIYSLWGLSLFLVAPFFIFIFKSIKNKDFFSKSLWVTSLITLIILLCYYAPGWFQFGPRYTMDFFPLLFLLLLISLKSKLTEFQKNFIVLSCLFNIYLLYFGTFYVK